MFGKVVTYILHFVFVYFQSYTISLNTIYMGNGSISAINKDKLKQNLNGTQYHKKKEEFYAQKM